MRISNWTQFAKIYGDPAEPDNGPFMEGAYLAHSVYGFFQNGGGLCWIVRVGDDGGNGRGPRRRGAAGGRRQRGRDLPRRRARRASTATSRSRSPRSPSAEGEDGGERATYTARSSTAGGRRARSSTGLTLKKGRNNLATKVNAASKLIKIEETGASLPEAQRAPATGTYTLSAPASTPDEGRRRATSRATSPRRGMGGLAGGRRDHDGRACPTS